MFSNNYILCFIIAVANGSELLSQLGLIYKDTYVVYGKGRRSERDLPVCDSAQEACNFAHIRPWLRPITERLCRCPRKAHCPLSYEEGKPENSQHVSNRAQLKFCEKHKENFHSCEDGNLALEFIEETKQSETNTLDAKKSWETTRTSLLCNCLWPKQLLFNRTNVEQKRKKSTSLYTCNELPKCQSNEKCGTVRPDTFEVYYSCSCPNGHICSYSQPTFSISLNLHYHGQSIEAKCSKLQGDT